jgi:hypothetical protein
MNAPFLVYTGRKDLGTEHVRAIVEALHWEWANCHFQHIRDYDDWKAEQDWLADQAAYDEQQEREAAEAFLSCNVSHQRFATGE